jgi:hypothetical protein
MSKPAKILLHTTIPFIADDWHIGRFSLLAGHLAGLKDGHGHPLFLITCRDRDAVDKPDSVLSTIDRSDFDELWLFAVDTGGGLTAEDCAAISRFRRAGRGLMVARDHMDLGSSVCNLGGVGAAHHFHTKNPSSDPAHRTIDDPYTKDILWPNFHSGANGDFQIVTPTDPLHPVLSDPNEGDGVLRYLPAHPHEGDVDAPADDPTARVIATGRSKVTGALFNLAVAFEPSSECGPAIAQSTFHHFADFNWDPRLGKPSFVSEADGHAILAAKEAQRSVRQYATNVANWLAGRPVKPHETKKQHQDRALDEALDESFPASDPPAVD